MTILYVDMKDKISADALATIAQEDVGLFDIDHPYHGSLTDITLAAHTSDDATRIGDRTPLELAKDFSRMFDTKDKSQLQHIYLISCEAGMSIDNKPSLAQKFAKAMHGQGFTNIQVHAVANPVGSPIVGMRVEVVNKGGASLSQPGEVRAFSYQNPESLALDNKIAALTETRAVLMEIKQKTPTEKRQLKDTTNELMRLESSKRADDSDKKFDFFLARPVPRSNYKVAMQQPHNTFSHDVVHKPISTSTAYAIHYLQLKQMDIIQMGESLKWDDKKIKGYIDKIYTLIDKLQIKPDQSADEILTILKAESALNKSLGSPNEYSRLVIKTLKPDLIAFEKEREAMGSHLDVPSRLSSSDDSEEENEVVEVKKPLIKKSHIEGPPHNSSAVKQRLQELVHRGASGPSIDATNDNAAFCDQLKHYKSERSKEWEYHYNFLGLVSIVYTIIDALTGSDHYNSKSR